MVSVRFLCLAFPDLCFRLWRMSLIGRIGQSHPGLRKRYGSETENDAKITAHPESAYLFRKSLTTRRFAVGFFKAWLRCPMGSRKRSLATGAARDLRRPFGASEARISLVSLASPQSLTPFLRARLSIPQVCILSQLPLDIGVMPQKIHACPTRGFGTHFPDEPFLSRSRHESVVKPSMRWVRANCKMQNAKCKTQNGADADFR